MVSELYFAFYKFDLLIREFMSSYIRYKIRVISNNGFWNNYIHSSIRHFIISILLLKWQPNKVNATSNCNLCFYTLSVNTTVE